MMTTMTFTSFRWICRRDSSRRRKRRRKCSVMPSARLRSWVKWGWLHRAATSRRRCRRRRRAPAAATRRLARTAAARSGGAVASVAVSRVTPRVPGIRSRPSFWFPWSWRFSSGSSSTPCWTATGSCDRNSALDTARPLHGLATAIYQRSRDLRSGLRENVTWRSPLCSLTNPVTRRHDFMIVICDYRPTCFVDLLLDESSIIGFCISDFAEHLYYNVLLIIFALRRLFLLEETNKSVEKLGRNGRMDGENSSRQLEASVNQIVTLYISYSA